MRREGGKGKRREEERREKEGDAREECYRRIEEERNSSGWE